MKDIITRVVENNDNQYTILKVIEELNELSTILTQYLTKPNLVDKNDIISEIGDVYVRLETVKMLFGEDKIYDRISYKLNKLKEYLDGGKYSNA